MKKFILFIVFFLTMAFTSCTTTNTISLPSLNGKTREEIKEILDSKGIKFNFKFSDTIVNFENEYDTFVKYGSNLKSGDKVDPSREITVYTTPLLLTGNYASTLKIDFEWEGLSFVNDGVGEVTLNYAIDGDTADFKDKVTGQNIRLRFLGVNTRESTTQEEPWGKQASDFTKAKLRNAKQIILQSDGSGKDMYGRYLGYVWVDGVLLNLELIDEAYSGNGLTLKDRYGEIFLEAAIHAKKTGRRFYGEIDPLYDYENKKFK